MGCSCLKSNLVIKSKIHPNTNENSHLLNSSSNNNNQHINIIDQAHTNNSNTPHTNNHNQRNTNNTNQLISNHNNFHGQITHSLSNNNINNNNNNQQITSNHINQEYSHSQNEIIRQINFEPYLISKHDPNFNFPELDNEYYGVGLKRMKGYISSINLEKLSKERDNFWTSRIEGNQEIWELLRAICNDKNLDDDDIMGMLLAGGIVLYRNCINVTYDSKGAIYEIPNYCINDPSQYDIPEIEYSKEIPKEEMIEITIRHFIEQQRIKIKNLKTVMNLKEVILKCYNKMPIGIKEKHLRLFFGGKELQNEKGLWFYNITNDAIVQLLLSPVILEEDDDGNNDEKNIKDNQEKGKVDETDENVNNEDDIKVDDFII